MRAIRGFGVALAAVCRTAVVAGEAPRSEVTGRMNDQRPTNGNATAAGRAPSVAGLAS